MIDHDVYPELILAAARDKIAARKQRTRRAARRQEWRHRMWNQARGLRRRGGGAAGEGAGEGKDVR